MDGRGFFSGPVFSEYAPRADASDRWAADEGVDRLTVVDGLSPVHDDIFRAIEAD